MIAGQVIVFTLIHFPLIQNRFVIVYLISLLYDHCNISETNERLPQMYFRLVIELLF